MRMQPRTLHLGEHRWQVRPLTLSQVQSIEPLLAGRPEMGQPGSGTVAAAVAIIRIALARDHAEAASQLDTVEAGAPDIASAMAVVLRLGGFLPETVATTDGDHAPGEAGAG